MIAPRVLVVVAQRHRWYGSSFVRFQLAGHLLMASPVAQLIAAAPGASWEGVGAWVRMASLAPEVAGDWEVLKHSGSLGGAAAVWEVLHA
mmetsp:Transcript_30319/g.77842  ORF Transcript_30319/g.77842 Transcript_30319/m.77842 type:complete len:90 (+) Transcript_30319:549-818(+)